MKISVSRTITYGNKTVTESATFDDNTDFITDGKESSKEKTEFIAATANSLLDELREKMNGN